MIASDRWSKSSRSSGNGGNCVETRAAPGYLAVRVRDSKHPEGPELVVDPTAWSAFTEAVKIGRLTG